MKNIRENLQSFLMKPIVESPSDERNVSPRPGLRTSLPSSPEKRKTPPAPLAMEADPSRYIPMVVYLVREMTHELSFNLKQLLSLNPSRRKALAKHIQWRGQQNLGPSAHSQVQFGPDDSLQKILSPPRSPFYEKALQFYLEEVALICIAQAILLKSWNDQGIRKWSKHDLTHLNWALSKELRNHTPSQRDSWRMISQNLYSWYLPSSQIQDLIWSHIYDWNLENASPQFISELIQETLKPLNQGNKKRHYSPLFYQSLWEQSRNYGFISEIDYNQPIPRKKLVFSPTLKEGDWVRYGPKSVTWTGLEADPFSLLVCEMSMLWKGPQTPPLWLQGTGLEVHPREQLALSWSNTRRSLLSQLSEIEAVDLCIVEENQPLRPSTRTIEGQLFKQQLENFPYFNSLKGPGTTLGHLQACVSSTKLRPDGLFWWCREERIKPNEGTAALKFLFEKNRLLVEWDLSEIKYEIHGNQYPFPTYIYLFQRDPHSESRKSHRPICIKARGRVSKISEYQPFLEDLFYCSLEGDKAENHSWKIHKYLSPTAQNEWIEHWPHENSAGDLQKIETLKANSSPLGQFAMIRQIPLNHKIENHGYLHGAWIFPDYSQGRKLKTIPFDEAEPGKSFPSQERGFMVVAPSQEWVGPLCAYIQSNCILQWMDFETERKNGRWILNESHFKYLPVPKSLILGIQGKLSYSSEKDENLKELLQESPEEVLELLSQRPTTPEKSKLVALLFIAATKNLKLLQTEQNRLFRLVKNDSQISWRELMKVIPQSEKIGFSLHSELRLQGSLPPHVAIQSFQKSSDGHSARFWTEAGHQVIVHGPSHLIDILWDQLEGIGHPTWNELTQYIQVPRHLEMIQTTAHEILRSHSHQLARKNSLEGFLLDCPFIDQV